MFKLTRYNASLPLILLFHINTLLCDNNLLGQSSTLVWESAGIMYLYGWSPGLPVPWRALQLPPVTKDSCIYMHVSGWLIETCMISGYIYVQHFMYFLA